MVVQIYNLKRLTHILINYRGIRVSAYESKNYFNLLPVSCAGRVLIVMGSENSLSPKS